MKKMNLFWTLLSFFFLTGTSVFAQPGRYGTGPDSTECRVRLSFYYEYAVNGDFLAAVPSWRIAMAVCPRGVNQQLYLQAPNIIKAIMGQPGVTPAHRSELIDSIMLVYDIRIQHYPQNAVTALYNKIIDMTQLKPSAKEEQLATVETLLNKMGDNAFPDMLVRYMGLVCNFYMEEKRTADDVMDAYTRVMAVFEAQEVKQPDSEVVRANKQLIENMLISSGVATCENLIALFTPRFIANPEDLELVSKIVSLLSSSDCGNSELFLQTVTTLNRLSPSYKTAYYLSKLHAAKGEFNEAVKYVREAINSPDITAVEKGQYLIDEGLFYFRNLNNQSRAMTAAKAAIEAHPSVKGKAYMLIASIWTRQNCGDTDIERRAPYWVAVDYFARAKAADPSCAAEADRMIAQFRQHFPLQEEAFMYDLSEGSEYTVVCNGMTEKTTVRTRK